MDEDEFFSSQLMSKRQRRAKLEKLQQMLGDPIPDNLIVSQNIFSSASSGSNSNTGSLSRSHAFRSSIEKLSKLVDDQNAVEALLASVIGFDIENDDDDDEDEDDDDDDKNGDGSRGSGSHSGESKEATQARRKRLRKLHHFFGDRPTRDMLFEQHIFKNLEDEIKETVEAEAERDLLKTSLDNLRARFHTKSAEDEVALHTPALPPSVIKPSTLDGSSTLSKKQRKIKVEKLQQVLGAPLPIEQLIGQSLFDESQENNGNTANLAFASENEVTDSRVLLSSISKLKTIIGDDEAMEDVLATIIDDEDDLIQAKEVRRKRMKKLYNFFGDRPARDMLFEQQILQSLEDIIERDVAITDKTELQTEFAGLRASFSSYKKQSPVTSSNSLAQPNSPMVPTPLSKKQRIKKLVKLQQILGSSLSEADQGMQFGGVDSRRSSVTSITSNASLASMASATSSTSGQSILQQLSRLNRIIDDQDAVEGLLASLLEILPAETVIPKDVRLKRLRKLHHFFGDRPQRDQLFENHVFHNIEAEIEEEVGGEERGVLKNYLQAIRKRFKEQSERDLRELGYRPQTASRVVKDVAQAPPNESITGLTKQQRTRKLNKLQELLGETLPISEQVNQSIVPSSSNRTSANLSQTQEMLKSSIKRLTAMLKDDPTALKAALQALQARVAKTQETGDESGDGFDDDDDDTTPQNKELKRKRLKKLQGFFGRFPTGELTETKLIETLENRINSEFMDDKAKDELRRELNSVRTSVELATVSASDESAEDQSRNKSSKAAAFLGTNLPSSASSSSTTTTTTATTTTTDANEGVSAHSQSERFSKQSMQAFKILGYSSARGSAEDKSSATLPSFLSVGDSANRQAIRRIDERFTDSNVLAVDGRVLVNEGTLTILNENGKNKKREFFLFNDILVYGKKVQKSRLGSKHILHLDNLGVIPIIDDIAADIKSAFHILLMSSPKRLTVCAESGGEKAAWIEQITACANYAVSHWYGTLREIDSGSVWAPLWMPEMDVKLCTVCLQTKFSLLKSKHHCSLCGLVVCNSCSNNFVPIAKDTAIAAAVISSAKRASSSPDTLSNSGSTSSGNGLTNSNSSNGNNSSLGNNTNFGSSASLDSESNFSSTTALNSSIDSPNILTLNVRVCDPCLEKGINAIANHSKLAQWNCDLGVIEQELANARNVLAHNAPNATKTQTESLNELVETLGKKFNHYVANIARIEYVIECRTRKRANVRSGQKVTIKKAKNLYDTVQMGIRLTSESDI